MTKYDFDYVALSGGEPLLFPGIEEVISYLYAEDQRAILTTNGIPFLEARANSLYKAGLREVQVALHSARSEPHDLLAGRKSWEGAVRALIVALERGMQTAVTFVRTNINGSELPSIIELLAALGVPKLIVNDMQVVGFARQNLDSVKPDESASQLEDRAREVKIGEMAGVEVCHIPASLARTSVALPWHRLAVSPSGALKICNLSVKSIGDLVQLSDLDLEDIVGRLSGGKVDTFRSVVDSCSCFERRTGYSLGTEIRVRET